MVNEASGMDRGRVGQTTTSQNMMAILKLIPNYTGLVYSVHI